MAFGLRKKNSSEMRQVNSKSLACEKVPTYFDPEPPLARKDSLKSSIRAVFGSKLKKPDPANTSSAFKEKICTDAVPRKSQRPSLGARVLKTLCKAQVFFRCGGQQADKLRRSGADDTLASVNSQEKSWKPLKFMTSATTSLPANSTQAESAPATGNDQKDSSTVASDKKSFSGRHARSTRCTVVQTVGQFRVPHNQMGLVYYVGYLCHPGVVLALTILSSPLALITGVAYCVSWVFKKTAISVCCILGLAVGLMALFADLLISM
ncbi:hypothetical protein DFH09DRAFT_1310671 [Mycena vulgaris]|nr:hypothetical protein DFH09DRAFT_1310671 [Mycena vulgaris]